MKSKKVTMLVAVLAVAVVAAAGIGYAATYQGTTTNSGNTADVTYVVISQEEDGAYAEDSFLGKNYFNTVTNATETTYTVTGEQLSITNEIKAYKISNDNLNLKITDTDNDNSYTLKITTTKPMSAGDISYYFGIKQGENPIKWSAAGEAGTGDDAGKTVWSISEVSANTSGITYSVYVAAVGSTTTAPQDVSDASFDFIVSKQV